MFDKNEFTRLRDLTEKELEKINGMLAKNEFQYEALEAEQVEQMLKDDKTELEGILKKIEKQL
jgi:predicted metal-dependent phosphoesterase TrpH